ncbi:MAG: BON domain-containing protein [Pseudobdellovibrionaceae bacterium]
MNPKIHREKNPLHAEDRSAGVEYDKSLTSPPWGAKEGNETGYNKTYGPYGSVARGWVDRPHAGKGPKNYQRSDESLNDEIFKKLTLDPDIDATNIEVEVKEGSVLLTGWVPERKMRYWAEEVITKVRGVSDINNQIKVKK